MDYRLVPEFQQVAGGFTTVRGYKQSAVVGDDLALGSVEYRLPPAAPVLARSEPPELPGMGTFRLRPAHLWDVPDWDLIFRVFSRRGLRRGEPSRSRARRRDARLVGRRRRACGAAATSPCASTSATRSERPIDAATGRATRAPTWPATRSLLGWTGDDRDLRCSRSRSSSGRAAAAPAGEHVVSGEATFTRDGSLTLITTSTPRRSSTTRASTSAAARRCGSTSRALARILNNVLSTDPTQIDGVLTSNGRCGSRIRSACSSATRRSSTWAAGRGGGQRRRGRVPRGTERFSQLTGRVEVGAGAQIRAADSVLLVGAAVANYGNISTARRRHDRAGRGRRGAARARRRTRDRDRRPRDRTRPGALGRGAGG
jgi:hypothetical protein